MTHEKKDMSLTVENMETLSKNAYELFLTWSPNPKGVLYGCVTPKSQRGAIMYITDLFKYVGEGYYVCEFTTNGNIHIHALFNLKNYARWYGRVLPKLKRDGNTNVQKVKNIQEAHKYLKKEIENNKILLGEGAGASFLYSPKYKRIDKESLLSDNEVENLIITKEDNIKVKNVLQYLTAGG